MKKSVIDGKNTCKVKPQFFGTIPVPKPMKLLLMNEHAFPSRSDTVKYAVSCPKSTEPCTGTSMALKIK